MTDLCEFRPDRQRATVCFPGSVAHYPANLVELGAGLVVGCLEVWDSMKEQG